MFRNLQFQEWLELIRRIDDACDQVIILAREDWYSWSPFLDELLDIHYDLSQLTGTVRGYG